MKKLLFILLLSQIIFAQDTVIQKKIPNNVTSEKILNNYFKKIGGEKNINQIKSLEKYFTIEIAETNGLNVYGSVIYQHPHLYSSTSIQEIANMKQIISTKYNGINCIVTRDYNGEKNTSKIEGKLLQEKLKDFTPFPILAAKNNNITFEVVEIHQIENTKLYKLYMKDPTNKDSLFFFFDAKSHYLIKKEVTGIKNTKITHYKDYKKVDKIMFPFLEVSTIHIDGKIAQKSSNTINQIKINQDIPATEFE